MGFWDANDNFEFEKVFCVAENQEINEELCRIWYLKSINKWCTTDKHNQIIVWNIETEKIDFVISKKYFSKNIINMVEIDHIKLIAIVTQDNFIYFFDFFQRKQLFRLQSKHDHIHSLLYFYEYQLLLTAGFDNLIHIYEIVCDINDYNELGQLYGHNTMITAVSAIEGTPMVISTDDRFNIKIWDIRTKKCI